VDSDIYEPLYSKWVQKARDMGDGLKILTVVVGLTCRLGVVRHGTRGEGHEVAHRHGSLLEVKGDRDGAFGSVEFGVETVLHDKKS
jgi:hypothetical protein